MSPLARICGDKRSSGESEVKEREQQGGEIKNGTLEMWRRARQNSVQDSRELTVNIQPPGEERGKNSFVSKS